MGEFEWKYYYSFAKFRVHGLPLKAPVTCASILDYGRALQAATAPIEVKKYRLEV